MVLFLTSIRSHAQQPSIDLTQEQIEQINQRISDKLENFLSYLQMMADKKNSQRVRNSAHQRNLNLFIGKCEPYEEFNLYSHASHIHEAVKMQTSSVNNNKITTQKIKNYFSNLMNNKNYANIKIDQADTFYISNIRKTGEDRYEAVARIKQVFMGMSENGGVRYGDITEKAVRIYIERHTVATPNGYEDVWDIMLGDMKVLSTSRL